MGVVITGGLGALGRAVGQVFLGKRRDVVVIDAASGELERATVIAGVDLTDPAATSQAFAAAAGKLGRINVLVNVAGAYAWSPADALPVWQQMFELNLRTCVNACAAALDYLAPGARVVNVGAASAARATAGHGPYAAAKAGVARLTEALAAEWAGRGIAVNAVLPGIIDTPANRAAMPEADPAEWTHPAAVADVVAFLASPAARGLSGALVPVTAPAQG